MITKREYERAAARTLEYFDRAGIALTDAERKRIEVADFGLSDLGRVGLQLLTYVNTDRVCAKEMVLFPGQTCPEHRHVDSAGAKGKEETFRCRAGEVWLYVEGDPTPDMRAKPFPSTATVFHEVILKPGMQYTIYPDTRHWFQGGPEGAVVSEFSTMSTDETDVFTDPAVERETRIEG